MFLEYRRFVFCIRGIVWVFLILQCIVRNSINVCMVEKEYRTDVLCIFCIFCYLLIFAFCLKDFFSISFRNCVSKRFYRIRYLTYRRSRQAVFYEVLYFAFVTVARFFLVVVVCLLEFCVVYYFYRRYWLVVGFFFFRFR